MKIVKTSLPNRDHQWARDVAGEWIKIIKHLTILYENEMNYYKNKDIVNILRSQMAELICKHIKNQKKCLLMLLHIGLLRGTIITDSNFNKNKFSNTFFGWDSFRIIDKRFLQSVEETFPCCINRLSINNVFRRSGFTPHPQWNILWQLYDNHIHNPNIHFKFGSMKR